VKVTDTSTHTPLVSRNNFSPLIELNSTAVNMKSNTTEDFATHKNEREDYEDSGSLLDKNLVVFAPVVIFLALLFVIFISLSYYRHK
jgi:hypothetical protein